MSLRLPRRISRFERKILLAIFLSGVAPFVLSLFFIPEIVESRFAMSVHEQVREQLESSAVFYKEFFQAKKREFAARVEAMAKDPVLLRAALIPSVEDVRERVKQLLQDNVDLRSVRIYRPEGDLMLEEIGPEDRQTADFTPKTLTLPLGVGDSPRIEVVFILPIQHIQDRDRAEEIAVLYDTAFKLGTNIQDQTFYTYVFIISGILFLALAAGYVLARQVTKRISQLAFATERVAKGDLEFEVKPRGKDEITELTSAFNSMIAEVKDARDRIVYLEKVSGWQEFARRLAHEIKNPLTPIQLAIQELKRRTPEGDEKFKRFVDDAADVVEEEIKALTRLVDEFSQFARLPEVVPDKVELSSFVQEFLSAYNGFEPDAKVTLDLPEQALTVPLDRVLMRRVFLNLALNGIQAAGEGKAELWIKCRKLEDSEEAEIRIEDNGPGIPPDQASRIFDPYFTTKEEGTGLGLAIVKKIVLQHGGTIQLDSSSHGGAAFVIVLPLKTRAK